MIKRKNIGWMIPALILVISSCKKNGAEQNEPAVALPVEHGVATGDAIKKNIGSAGGTIQTADGSISIVIPPGAVNTTTEFSIQPVSSTLPAATGITYRLGPENVNFNKDVTISFRYSDQDLAGTAENELYLAYQDAQGYWHREVMTSINNQNKTLSVTTKHFSDWAIERMFYIDVLFSNGILSAGEEVGLFVNMSDVDTASKIVVKKQPVPIKNIDGWFVNGPGTLDRKNLESATYKAPASIPEPKTVAVGVGIKNLVNSRHPDRPGNSGLVIVQVPLQLVGDEYFVWDMGGVANTAVAMDAGLLGGTINLIGTGMNGSVSIWANGSKAQGYDLGNSSVPEYFNLQVMASGSSHVVYMGTYYKCNDNTPQYGKGKLNITKFGSVGGNIEGNFTATVYFSSSGCEFNSKQITGSFKMKRKA